MLLTGENPTLKNQLLKNIYINNYEITTNCNLITSLKFIKEFTLNSSKESQQGEVIKTYPFLETNQNIPVSFEIIFIHNNILYRYGFKLISDKVIKEWLFAKFSTRETMLFIRNRQEFTLGRKFKEGKNLISFTRPNALFLSVCAQFNGTISTSIIYWFHKIIFYREHMTYTTDIIQNYNELYSLEKDILSQFINNLNINISLEEILFHFEGNNIFSTGTNKILNLLGYIINGLNYENILFIDDNNIATDFHMSLLNHLIEFTSSYQTKSNAQIVIMLEKAHYNN